MTYYDDWKKQYDALSVRDRKIHDLARKSTSAMVFALQNAHSDGIVMKYEKQSEDAMNELWAVLTSQSESTR